MLRNGCHKRTSHDLLATPWAVGDGCLRRVPFRPSRGPAETLRASLSQQGAALSEDGDDEGGWKPIHDGAQLFERAGIIADAGAEHGEVAGGVQFEQRAC